MTDHPITVTVNGAVRTAHVEPRTSLAEVIRHEFRLTGTHVACEQGVCGACTVLLDGAPVRACLMLAVQADGAQIETVEGLAEPSGRLAALQTAVMEEHGLQCGFCTPGILMSLTFADRADLSADQVTDDVMLGHLCRCTGYAGIRAAIERHWREKESAE